MKVGIMADNTSYAIPKDGISVTSNGNYAFVEIPRICGNCKHWERNSLVRGTCIHPDILECREGISQNFGCVPLWEAKESEGEK